LYFSHAKQIRDLNEPAQAKVTLATGNHRTLLQRDKKITASGVTDGGQGAPLAS